MGKPNSAGATQSGVSESAVGNVTVKSSTSSGTPKVVSSSSFEGEDVAVAEIVDTR